MEAFIKYGAGIKKRHGTIYGTMVLLTEEILVGEINFITSKTYPNVVLDFFFNKMYMSSLIFYTFWLALVNDNLS